MGCLPLHLVKRACSTGPSTIKVMTVEGRYLRFDAPIIVKEVLMEYPGHVLFLSDCVRSLGERARPLPSTLSLQAGSVYFLIPQPTLASSRLNSAASMETSTPPARSSAATSRSARPRKVSFATSTDSPHVDSAGSMASFNGAAANSFESLKKSSVEFLPSPSERVLRLKMVVSKKQLACVLREGGDCSSMVVSKKQLACVLREGGDCSSMVEGLLSALLQEGAATSNISCNVSWRPSLQSIPESTSCPSST